MNKLFYMIIRLFCKIALAGRKLNVPLREVYCPGSLFCDIIMRIKAAEGKIHRFFLSTRRVAIGRTIASTMAKTKEVSHSKTPTPCWSRFHKYTVSAFTMNVTTKISRK